MKIIAIIGLIVICVHVGSSLLIGAFNIKSFGNSKASNATLLDIITKVVHRYDILVIQEVRDTDLTATNKLMQSVNGGSSSYEYQYIVSEPLGRSTYKERYLFIYRVEAVSVANSFQYDDGCEPCGTDTFNREPFVVMFSSNTGGCQIMTNPLIFHTTSLSDISNNHWIALLHKFDASKIRLRTEPIYNWLISDSTDTTVTHTDCPYDRIVATSDMMSAVSPGSAQVFDFMEAQGLSQSWALAVSDHFPVEVELM
ncbi:deoxyribonuclease-1 [Misgurnus anguillicaudatus]|uniref:deoxyribonuclease-1 n=1 Tax=Misgurnus anguillicaudatus TaxID=75329 RepID=UPI003CCFBD1F